MSVPVRTPNLARRVSGPVLSPGEDGFDAARRAWNLSVDQRPALVVRAETADDVAETVRFARSAGLRVAPQGTGHNAAALGDLTDAILLRTDGMRTVRVNAHDATARADAGALWDDVMAAATPHSLSGLMGSSGGVGIAGYLLGGGCSWFGRKRGLACNAITAIEVVAGDGRVRRIDADNDAELFWAVRGGGGNAAIATTFEFGLYPAALVYGGAFLFPMERAPEVFAAYRDWARGAPEDAGTCVRLLRLPPLPEMPEQLRGRAFVGIDGVIDLPEGDAAALLSPLRALGPEIDTFAAMPTTAIGQVHMDPPGPVPGRGDGMLLTELSDALIDAMLAVAGPNADCPLLAVDLRHIGGALGRPVAQGGAIDHLPGEFMLYAVGVTPTLNATATVMAGLAAVTDALEPWSAGSDYLNFCETPLPAARFYPSEVLERLREVRRHYDPDAVVMAGHEWDR